ncbi:MAG: CPBP family intramembrane metalloprotease [Crenarchaeota archaeon]|nr:CPBP family intramembrane metalloprotease [Thermoproteota archaeon]
MVEFDNSLNGKCESSNKVVLTIRKHPVVWFFVFAFAISWATIFAQAVVGPASFISIPGVFAPAIGGMIVAACMNPESSHASVKKRILVFSIVFVISVAVFLFLAYMSSWNVGLGFYVSYTVTALLAAYTFSSYYHPVQGVAQMFSGLNQKGKNPIWLLIAAVLPLFFAVVGALINLGLGQSMFQFVTVASITSLILFIPNMFLFGGPSGEEPGWRGFATPKMQKYNNPLVVGFIIGLMWTAWHLPLYWTGAYSGGIEAAVVRFIWNTALGVLFAWVYNESNGNLLAALTLHTSNNIVASLFPPSNYYMMWAVMISFTAIAVIATKFWRKSNRLSLKQTAPSTANKTIPQPILLIKPSS